MHSIHGVLATFNALACSIQKLLGLKVSKIIKVIRKWKDTCNDCKYTHQNRKVNTYSTLIISYTNSIDGKCPYIIWKRNSSSIRIIANDDLEIHAWLNTFIKPWQGLKSKIAKSHQNTAINENTLSMERCACQKIQSCCLSFCHFSPPPPHFRRIRGTFAHSSSPKPPYLVENIPPRSR